MNDFFRDAARKHATELFELRQRFAALEVERDRLEEALRFVAGDGANARTVCDLHPNGVWILSDEQKSRAREALGEL